eukprot:15343109-Ditylum_brightwellii.AAC.2
MKKIRPADITTKTLVLSINCKKDNADYLKTMLTEAYRQEDAPYGQFVPHGLLQTEGPATYRSILNAQNKFLNNHTATVIRVMSAEASAMKLITEHGKTTRIDDYIEKDLGVEAIEQSNMTQTEGTWFLICKKNKTS